MTLSHRRAIDRSVLVVDDTADLRQAVAEVLRHLGFQPTQAGSGREALRVLSTQRFSAVLLDLQLPDLSGSDVMDCVRLAGGPNGDSRFVLMSASAEVARDVAARFHACIDKPVDARQLEVALTAPVHEGLCAL